MKRAILNFLRDERGLTAVEYAIAGALVILVAAGAFTLLGTAVDGRIGDMEQCVQGVCP
jgi:pilus assembly protein Flp/PilA